MKKIIIALCMILLFTGCSCSLNDHTPEEAIDTFFEKYRQKDDDVITQLKDTIESVVTNDEAKKDYQDLMEKQYDQFAYVIKNLKKDNDKATASIELTVLDYKSALKKAEEELKNNPEKFNDDKKVFSEEKYMNYKIEKMKEVEDTKTYTIEMSLTKKAGMWTVSQLSDDDISKLHGLY